MDGGTPRPSPPQNTPQHSPECSMIPLSVSLASPMPGRDPTGDSGETPCPHAAPQGAPMGAPPPAPPPALSIAPALPAAAAVMAERGTKARPCLLCLPSCRSYDKQRCANTCLAAGVARTRPIPGAKVVGVRRGAGGPRSRPGRFRWEPLPVFISFPPGLEAAPALGGGCWPWESGSPPVPRHPPALGGGQRMGGSGAEGVLTPGFASLSPPTAPHFPRGEVERFGDTEAGDGGLGSAAGRGAMPYLGARRRCRLCCAGTRGRVLT